MQNTLDFRHFWNFVRWQFYENPWFYGLSWVGIFLTQLAYYQTSYIVLFPLAIAIQVILFISYTSFVLRHYTTTRQAVRYLMVPVSNETKFVTECLFHGLFLLFGWLGYTTGYSLGMKFQMQFSSSPFTFYETYLLVLVFFSLSFKAFHKNALIKAIVVLFIFFVAEAYLTTTLTSLQLSNSWVKSIRLYDENAVVNLIKNQSNLQLYLTDVSIRFVNDKVLGWGLVVLVVVASYFKTKEKTI